MVAAGRAGTMPFSLQDPRLASGAKIPVKLTSVNFESLTGFRHSSVGSGLVRVSGIGAGGMSISGVGGGGLMDMGRDDRWNPAAAASSDPGNYITPIDLIFYYITLSYLLLFSFFYSFFPCLSLTLTSLSSRLRPNQQLWEYLQLRASGERAGQCEGQEKPPHEQQPHEPTQRRRSHGELFCWTATFFWSSANVRPPQWRQ